MSVKETPRGSREGNKANKYLRRISRLSAWALLVGIIVLIISGWGITQTEIIYKTSLGLIDRGVANSIHRAVHIPIAVFFLAHVLINVKFSLSPRSQKKAWLTNSILIAVGAGLLILAVYMEYFA